MTSGLIDVTAAEVLHDRVLRLTFETGEVRDVEGAPLLWGADLSAPTLYRLGQPVTTRSAG